MQCVDRINSYHNNLVFDVPVVAAAAATVALMSNQIFQVENSINSFVRDIFASSGMCREIITDINIIPYYNYYGAHVRDRHGSRALDCAETRDAASKGRMPCVPSASSAIKYSPTITHT